MRPGNAQGTSGVEQVQLCRFLFQMGLRVRIPLPPAASQERTVARANKRALKPGTWPVVWLSEATDVAQLEVLLAPLPFRKMIC
jgi:hypothetical protein